MNNLLYWEDPNKLMCTDPAADAAITSKVKEQIKKATPAVTNSCVAPCPIAVSSSLTSPQYDPANKKCNFKSFKITKPGRGFDLIVKPDTPNNQRILAVIAGFKALPAKVFAELQGPIGPCANGHNRKRSFETGSSTLKILPETTENKLALEVVSATNIKILPWRVPVNKHKISANRCGHVSEFFSLEVYPDTEAEVSVTWHFGEVSNNNTKREDIEKKKSKKKGQGIKKTTHTTTNKKEITKGLEIAGKLKYDGKERELEASFKTTIETIKKTVTIIETAHEALRKIKTEKENADFANIFDSPISMGMIWPNVGIKLGGKWIEEKGKPTVTYQGTIGFTADPFIGFSFKWNITDTVLQFVPGGYIAKKVIKKMKAKALALELSMGGELAGELTADIVNWDVKNVAGKVDGKIPVELELTAFQFDVDNCLVHGTVDVKMGVESGFLGTASLDSINKVIIVKTGFLDLVVWCSGVIEGGFGRSDSGANTEAVNNSDDLESTNDSADGKLILYKVSLEDSAKERFRFDFNKQ